MDKSKEIDRYINAQSQEVKEKLDALRAIIWEAIPSVTELLNYNIPAFALVPNGKREEQIMMAGYKKHIGFYPHPTVIEKFQDELVDYKFAKGSVQFKLDVPLPKPLIIKMISYRVSLLKN